MTVRRVRLGGRRGLLASETVWRSEAGLEVDETEAGWLTRRRIPWEDVLLVTCHRRSRVLVILLLGGAVLFTLLVAALARHWAPLVVLLLLLPALALELALGMQVVTVLGRGVRARVEIEYRRGRALTLMQELGTTARARQSRLAAARPRSA